MFLLTNITASIVLYRNDALELQKAIESVLNTSKDLSLYLIDNSPSADLKVFQEFDPRIIYIHNPTNPGFGAAHNIAIEQAMASGSNYHFIVNPDIFFNQDVINPMVNYMKSNPSIGMLMPEILNLDGTVQNLQKLLPSPFISFLRKIKRPQFIYEKLIDKYELRFVDKRKIYNAPILSGCFTLLNMKAINEIGKYDDDFFMYFEDWDLSRRMHKKYETIYYPEVSVYHGYEKGSTKKLRLLLIHVKSAFTYYNKWGWFFDIARKKMNKKTLEQFRNESTS